MLMRISLIVAIIAGLAVGTLNFIKVKEKITVIRQERDDWQNKYTETDRQLTERTRELTKSQADLKQTQEALATTTTERDAAVADAQEKTKAAEELTTRLQNLTGELNTAQEELARYKFSGLTPEQVLVAAKTIAALQTNVTGLTAENKVLRDDLVGVKKRLQFFEGITQHITLPAHLRGKVLVSDPKWDFVIVDLGKEDGIVQDGEMLINRNGKLVAKVIVRSVDKDRSVANVLPGWRMGEPMEGDEVIAAHPGS